MSPSSVGRPSFAAVAITTQRLLTTRTARLVSVGRLLRSTRLIIIACHGYGMEVTRFAESFAGMPEEVVVLCPEGLSRFYWGGFEGKPVASWMTSLERDAEIEDFCAWLQRVYDLAEAGAPTAKIAVFGFSQGAATVMRWLHDRRPAVDAVVLWSGTPPEDIAYAPAEYFGALRRLAYWGDADELVAWARAARRFEEVALNFDHRQFAGGHELTASALRDLVGELLDAA